MDRGRGDGSDPSKDPWAPDTVTGDIPPEVLDDLFACLANRRRRLLLEGVASQSDPRPIEEIVQFISEREDEAPSGPPSNEHVDSIEIGLVHNHLPKLDSAGVIDVDYDGQTVRKADRFDLAVSMLGRV